MTWKIAGINFEHLHMGDNLRMVFDHPDAEIVGICDENSERMSEAISDFGIPDTAVFTDYRECVEKTRPDIVLLCPATGRHREWVENVAPLDVHVILEKPFASSLVDADAMIDAMRPGAKLFSINWPMAWYAGNRTAKRMIDEGVIGNVIQVHYYDGNRGPLFHLADKLEVPVEEARAATSSSWFYQKDLGGGALLDYLGYGMTLGLWFRDGKMPLEMTTVVDVPPGLEVEEHGIVVARYDDGLSKFEARWGTFTDPWVQQPQPKCGFVIVGSEGTISIYDYESTIRVQTRDCLEGKDVPVDAVESPYQNPVQYAIHCLESGQPVDGPVSPELSRAGQILIDCAIRSAAEKRTVSVS